MKKKTRKLLDTNTKNPGGAKKGDVRNPVGKVAGTLMKATTLTNETKTTLIQSFQRSQAPQVLTSMLNMKLPLPFVPRHIKDKLKTGVPLTPEEDMLIVHEIKTNWKWALEWYAKIFPKTMGVFGLVQTEETLAGRLKQATKATKSPNVIDLVKRKMEKEMYIAEE